MSEWISVKDELPSDHQRALCNVPGYYDLVLCYYACDNTWHDLEDCWYDVNYWMPLPDPPKERMRIDMNEWISVKDRLPDPGTSVIVTTVLGSGQRVVRAATYTTFGFSGNGNFTDVRAWIKMPEPYEEEDE